MGNKLLKAVLHTRGQEIDPETYSVDERKIIRAYMDAWDGVHITAMKTMEGEYSVVGWPPEEEEKAKEAIYLMEQDPTFGTYVNDREKFDEDWAAGSWEPSGAIVFPDEMVEILGELKGGSADE